MATHTRGALTLELPDHVTVMPADVDDASLRSALRGCDGWSLVGAVDFVVEPRASVQPVALVSRAPATLRAPVDPDGELILAAVDDGVHRWEKGVRQASSDSDEGGGDAEVTFALDKLFGSVGKTVRGWVFRVAKAVVGGAVVFDEALINPGLVHLREPDPDTWEPLGGVELPDDSPIRILLFVHGIFVNTWLTFRALGKGNWAGSEFLAMAIHGGDYHYVLGYDHKTLSIDPGQNASDLLGELHRTFGGRELVIDVVAHSRGSLVTRSLVEQKLVGIGEIKVRRVVMAGAPNAGSEIVDPGNWRLFIDAYTTILVDLLRRVGGVVGDPLAGVVEFVSEFVKAVLVDAIDGVQAPGLSAMKPGSDFLKGLNTKQLPPLEVGYSVVTADFEPTLAVPPFGAGWRVLDYAVDKIIGESNDIAVDTNSMPDVDQSMLPARSVFAVPQSTGTHHLSYFAEDAVVAELTRRLLL